MTEAVEKNGDVGVTRPAGMDVLRAAVIVLLTFVAYLPAIRAGFVWDDLYLIASPLIKAGDGLFRIWCTLEPRDYFPVAYSSFWLQWRLWDMNPAGYHVLNIVLHAFTSILIWLVLKRLNSPGAWLCALLFAVHPINVESVAWISEQKNTLAMLFFLLSILSYLNHESSGRRWPFVASLLLFALSLLSKPLAVMWPFVLVGYAWWKRGRVEQRDVWRALPFFALSALSIIVTIFFHHAQALGALKMGADTIPGRLVLAFQALLFYWGKTLLPVNLCAIYSSDDLGWLSPTYAVLAALLLFAIASGRKYGRLWIRHALFGLGFSFMMLVPVLGLLDISFMFYSPVCDRWAYPFSAGILALLCAAGVGLVSRQSGALRGVGVVAAVLIVCLFSFLSFDRSGVFRDSETLFRDTLAKNPRAWAAYATLGNLAFDKRHLDEAEAFYRQALRFKPDYWEAYNGLGIVYAVRGRLDKAIPLFTKVLELNPGHHVARRNLEMALKERRTKASGAGPGQ